jgi:hypothetical protein
VSEFWRLDLSGLFKREEDLLAEKLENMLFESLRSLGEAGDWGVSRKGAFGVGRSAWVPSIPGGDAGLKGLIGEGAVSFPPFGRMAKDRVEDLGIFLRGFLGRSGGWWFLSTAVPWSSTVPACGVERSDRRAKYLSERVQQQRPGVRADHGVVGRGGGAFDWKWGRRQD